MNGILNKRWIAMGASVVVAAGLAACGGEDEAASGGGGGAGEGGTAKVSMLLSFPESIYWTPLLVAQEQGYFAEEGIELDVQATEGSGFVTQQIIAGNADFGWAAAGDDVVALSRDPSLRVLSCNPPKNIFALTVPEDSPIQSVAELKGKTLGLTEAGGGEEPIVNAALADAGLEREKDVKILPIGAAGPQSIEAIRSGKVDAYASSYPDFSSLAAEGLPLRSITPAKYDVIPGDCLLMKEETLKDETKRKQAVGIARAWAKGALFAQTNPEAALAIGCKAVPEECEDMDFAKQYSEDTIEYSKAGAEGQPFGVVPVDAWQVTADLLRSTDTIKTDVDVNTFAASPEIKQAQEEYGDFDAAAVEQDAQEFQE